MGATDREEESVDTALPAGPAYRSARPELDRANLAVGVVLTVVTLSFVVSLVSAALTGWALAIDRAGAALPIEEMDLSAPVSRMVLTGAAVGRAAAPASVAAVLFAAVHVIRWQTRALGNLTALGVAGTVSTWWAGLVWFLPGWGLVGPKQTFDELWRTSERRLPRQPDRGVLAAVRIPGFHAAWWALWVGASTTGVVVAAGTADHPAAGSLLVWQLVAVAVTLALLGSGTLLRRVLTQTTERQDARYAELSSPARVG